MKVKKIEYIVDEENYSAKLLINSESYGFGITKLEIIDDKDIRIHTTKSEKNNNYGDAMPKDMHRVSELEKYDNIKIIEE